MIEGRCLCGAVTIRVGGGHDPRVAVCHCRMCQRWSGGVFACFDAAADRMTVAGPVATFRSSAFAERAFCPTCGSHLWMRNVGEHDDGLVDLMPGLFDAARGWPLRDEIYADRAFAAFRLAGGHPRRTAADYETTDLHVEGDMP